MSQGKHSCEHLQEAVERVRGSGSVVPAPDRPAVAEALPGFVVAGWEASRRRQNFPPRYSRGCTPTMVSILDQPDMPERIRRGRLGTGGNSPAEFRQYMLADLVKWAKLVKESGAKLD